MNFRKKICLTVFLLGCIISSFAQIMAVHGINAKRRVTPPSPTTNLLPGFAPLNLIDTANTNEYDEELPIEVDPATIDTPLPGSGIWAALHSNSTSWITFPMGLNDGDELAYKYIGAGDMYFTLGLKSFWYYKGVGADYTGGSFDEILFNYAELFVAALNVNDYVIIKRSGDSLIFYKTSDMDSSRTLLTTMEDFSGITDNHVSLKIYTYDNRYGSRIYYPQIRKL